MDGSVIISEELKRYCDPASDVILICIGSDRITGDCLGPVVGQLLTHHYNIPTYVYGTLENPVTALNLRSVFAAVKKRHQDCKIIAVDSCVGAFLDIGTIRVTRGGLLPGSASGKNLPEIGDINITAVTSDQLPSSLEFAAVRLGFVYELSQTIAKGVDMFFSEKRSRYSNACKKIDIRNNIYYQRNKLPV